MHALSIRQPYAELILRGVKTVEYRTRPVRGRLIGRRFAIYAPGKWADLDGDELLDWSALTAVLSHPRKGERGPDFRGLPRGVLVGSAVISHCSPPPPEIEAPEDGEIPFGHCWRWHLKAVRRWKRPRKLSKGIRPQPVWFRLRAA